MYMYIHMYISIIANLYYLYMCVRCTCIYIVHALLYKFNSPYFPPSFNPVAHTSLVKTLLRIATAECSSGEARKPPRGVPKFHMPPREVVERLAESSVGDIRSAINSLQFTCLKGAYSTCTYIYVGILLP